MSSTKARRVDFVPAEFIAGVAARMTPADLGVYWMVCALVYERGGPIDDNPAWLARMFLGTNSRAIKSALDRLVESGLIYRTLVNESPRISSNSCETEINRAVKRIETARENGFKGGRPSNENNNIEKPAGSGGAFAKTSDQYQQTNTNTNSSSYKPLDLIDVVRSAICRAYARADWTPGKGKRSATDVAGDWLAAGMTPARLAEIVGPICDRRVATGERAPTSLGYFDPAVREALAEAPATAGQPHDPAARYRQPLDWWAGGRSWRLSGPEPDADPAGFRLAHPDCPAGLVAEAVQRRRAAVAAGSGR